MSRPIRMATTGIRLRLQSADAPVLTDSLFGDQDLLVEDRHGLVLELQGQFRNFQQEAVRAGYTGDLHPSSGYVVFSRAYLDRQGLSPSSLRNARIVEVKTPQGWEPKNLIIQEARDRGHLSGGSLIVKFFFKKYGDDEGGM